MVARDDLETAGTGLERDARDVREIELAELPQELPVARRAVLERDLGEERVVAGRGANALRHARCVRIVDRQHEVPNATLRERGALGGGDQTEPIEDARIREHLEVAALDDTQRAHRGPDRVDRVDVLDGGPDRIFEHRLAMFGDTEGGHVAHEAACERDLAQRGGGHGELGREREIGWSVGGRRDHRREWTQPRLRVLLEQRCFATHARRRGRARSALELELDELAARITLAGQPVGVDGARVIGRGIGVDRGEQLDAVRRRWGRLRGAQVGELVGSERRRSGQALRDVPHARGRGLVRVARCDPTEGLDARRVTVMLDGIEQPSPQLRARLRERPEVAEQLQREVGEARIRWELREQLDDRPAAARGADETVDDGQERRQSISLLRVQLGTQRGDEARSLEPLVRLGDDRIRLTSELHDQPREVRITAVAPAS
jgi:hypothetical protein